MSGLLLSTKHYGLKLVAALQYNPKSGETSSPVREYHDRCPNALIYDSDIGRLVMDGQTPGRRNRLIFQGRRFRIDRTSRRQPQTFEETCHKSGVLEIEDPCN